MQASDKLWSVWKALNECQDWLTQHGATIMVKALTIELQYNDVIACSHGTCINLTVWVVLFVYPWGDQMFPEKPILYIFKLFIIMLQCLTDAENN